MSDLTIDAQLAKVFAQAAKPAPIADGWRPLTSAEQAQVEYGEVVEAQGDYLVLLGTSIQYAAEAQADPDFYAALAARYTVDAEAARQAWIAKQAAYAAKHRGNAPNPLTGD